jgi:hypothetical protein
MTTGTTGTTGNYPEEYKEYFMEVMYDVFINLIQNKQPFRIAITANDNWSIALNPELLAKKVIVLDVADQAMNDSYYDADTGLVFMSTGFDGEQATKYVEVTEVLALLDATTGNPFMVRPFNVSPKKAPKPEMLHNDEKIVLPKTLDGLVQGLVDDGFSEEGARRSVDAFAKHNPELAEKFK